MGLNMRTKVLSVVLTAGLIVACDDASQAINTTKPKDATAVTRTLQSVLAAGMPKNIERELEFANRGFIAAWPASEIERLDGKGLSIDFLNNDFITGKAPDTVNPLLWRHMELSGKEGLYKVSEGIYQVRGFDVSNITFIETDNGYVVVDPLTASEAAAAAYTLIKEHVGDRPIVGVIYTHSHSDHFAGIGGILSEEDIASGNVPIIAPEGFLEETAKEWMIAGNAMGRRAFYQFGLWLPYGERQSVGMGTGPRIALGDVKLVPPTRDITHTGEVVTVDGLDIVFQMAPGAEAPVEINFYIPKYKALCMAETATATIHNVQTLRGAAVRDAKGWADYLTEADTLFGADTEVLFVTHHWPRFGNEYIRTYLAKHRDAYKYLHDQTVRMMNTGMTPNEISDALSLPESLNGEWYNRGFYGSISHNVKAVYDKYMGWYNGIPAELNPHAPVERGRRYMDAMGGQEGLLAEGQKAFDEGDYRWSAELLQHLVFAAPSYRAGRELLADSYEQLGYVAESAIWRNIYLTGAKELRQGGADKYTGGSESYILEAATDDQVLDLAAVRLLPEKSEGKELSLNIKFRETQNSFNLRVKNSVLVYHQDMTDTSAETLEVSREGFLAVAFGYMPLAAARIAGMVSLENGSGDAIKALSEMMENPSLDFEIILP